MADQRVKNNVPKRQRKMPLDMPMATRSLENGRFMPRKGPAGPKPKSYAPKGVLPTIQPRRKPVLNGVYDE